MPNDEAFKIVIHPSVISYDYRIAWTWEEMDKRNKYNNNIDSVRHAFGLPGRPYGKPLYSVWTTHRGKDRGFVLGNFGSGKTDLTSDRW